MSTVIEADPRVESLLRDAVVHRAEPLPARERLVEGISAVALLAAVAALASFVPGHRAVSPAAAAGLVAVFVAAKSVTFRVGSGTLSPTEPLLIASVLLLPPAAAVLLVLVASILARIPEYATRRQRPDHGPSWIGQILPGCILSSGRGAARRNSRTCCRPPA